MDGTDPSRPGALLHSRDISSSSQTAGWFQACWNEPWQLCPHLSHPRATRNLRVIQGHCKPHRLMLRIPFMTHPTPWRWKQDSPRVSPLHRERLWEAHSGLLLTKRPRTRQQHVTVTTSWRKASCAAKVWRQGTRAEWVTFIFTFNYYPSTSLTPPYPPTAPPPQHINEQSKKTNLNSNCQWQQSPKKWVGKQPMGPLPQQDSELSYSLANWPWKERLSRSSLSSSTRIFRPTTEFFEMNTPQQF